MRLRNRKMDVKGVIGIGTLIVFIAMVLVAAIASAVIIWTAENLEEDAERTGAGAREDVTGGINIKTVEGFVDTTLTPDAVDEVYLYIALYGGARDLDMNEVLLHVIVTPRNGQSVSQDLGFNPAVGNAAIVNSNYGTEGIVNPLGSFPSTLDQQSILKLTVLIDGTGLPYLTPDSDMEIKIMQAVGGPTAEEEITTPAGYPANGGIVDLTN